MAPSRIGSSPFLKRVLIPFWIVRLSVLVAEIALYSIAINFFYRHTNAEYVPGTKPYLIVMSTIVVLLALCVLLDIGCMVMRALNTLTPPVFLATNFVQTTIFVALFGLSMARAFTWVNLILNIIVLFSFAGLLVYASIIFHRHRKGTLPGLYREPTEFSESHKLVPHSEDATQTTELSRGSVVEAGTYDADHESTYYDTTFHDVQSAALSLDGQGLIRHV